MRYAIKTVGVHPGAVSFRSFGNKALVDDAARTFLKGNPANRAFIWPLLQGYEVSLPVPKEPPLIMSPLTCDGDEVPR